MAETIIPKATAKRLPVYYRYLNFLANSGTTKISSTELSDAVKVDSATIRRDFSYFGALGKRGYGYDVKDLLNFFKKILNQDRLTNVGLVGVGNLGHALMDEMIKQIKDQQIEIVILTVPIDAAQHITDDLVKAGIKGIMNFTPIRISVPSYVRVQNVDLATELQTLIYFLEHYGPTLNEPEA